MNLGDFVNTYGGHQLAMNDGKSYVGECVSLVKRFAQEVQKVPNADTVLQVPSGARQLYEGFDWNGKMSQYYDKIPYGQPRQKGDLVVWGSNLGQYGDVAIALDSGNTVFGQLGTPVFIPANIRVEARQPLGYLRFKGETMDTFNKGDATNIAQNFFGQDIDQVKSQVGQNWKTAMYNIVGSKVIDDTLKVNEGDAVNITKAFSLSVDKEKLIGQTFKAVLYNYIFPNMPKANTDFELINQPVYVKKD